MDENIFELSPFKGKKLHRLHQMNNSLVVNNNNLCSPTSTFSDLDDCFPSDDELDLINERFVYSDELPTFDIRSISPTAARTPSPIETPSPPNRSGEGGRGSILSCNFSRISLSPSKSPCTGTTVISNSTTKEEQMMFDLVPLKEINDQINAPEDRGSNGSLETIYEGVFLETPPKKICFRRVNLSKAIVRKSLNNINVADAENVQNTVETDMKFCKKV